VPLDSNVILTTKGVLYLKLYFQELCYPKIVELDSKLQGQFVEEKKISKDVLSDNVSMVIYL
jgi:hypothetical protein